MERFAIMHSSGLSIRLFAIALSVSLSFTLSSGYGHRFDVFTDKPQIMPHGGPMLNGTINLAMMWYGNCGKEIKNTIRNFIKSLEYGGKKHPKVSTWWEVVESYRSLMPNAPPGNPPKITVKVVKQSTDKKYNEGKVLTQQANCLNLIKHVTKGDDNVIPVIVAARDVTIEGLCHGKCSDHLLTDDEKKRPYIIVGNPETECPGECGWPFHAADSGLQGPVLKPPSGNYAADAMVIAFASALVDIVTSPMHDGIFYENKRYQLGPVAVCEGIFGRGASPGNPGEVQVDPKNGGHFNAHGNNHKKFLVPAIWNPATKSCWYPQ